jgi:hypothetical protein
MKATSVTLFLLVSLLHVQVFSQQEKRRLGVYDSRAIAVAHFQSAFGMQITGSLQKDFRSAKEKGDSVAIRKLAAKGELLQKIAHDQGFGKGSVVSLLDNVKDSVIAIGKKEHLIAIVSKWELVYSGSDIDTIDLTMELIEFFKPNDKVRNMVREIMKTSPIEDAFFIED